VPHSYSWAQEAQVDRYEAWVDLGDERTKVQVFAMRSMATGAAFHRAYLHATQQAFLKAREHAFAYFGGVFNMLRYDNLASAVRKVLRGHRREETVRFIAFRSHWWFAAEFCALVWPFHQATLGETFGRPCSGEGHEEGGIEGEGGYFRRNHLVPVPCVADIDALNALLLASCRAQSVGAALAEERGHLLSLVTEGFDLADVVFPLVDKQGCVTVKTNFYPVEARVHPLHVEIWRGGRLMVRHERCHSRHQHVLDLEHYLDVVGHKPGAFGGSRPRAQWRAADRWPACYDELWDRLRARHGKQNGTRAMVAVAGSRRGCSRFRSRSDWNSRMRVGVGHDRLQTAVASTVSLGACDVAAVRYLLTEAGLHKARPGRCRRVGALRLAAAHLADYDTLFPGPCAGTA